MTAETWYILGAGAMGTLIHHLCQSNEVQSELLHHRDQDEPRAIFQDGTRFDYAARPFADLQEQSIERLLVATKAAQVGPAVHAIQNSLTPNAMVVCIANGLGWEREIPENCPAVARALTTAGAYRDKEGAMHIVSTGSTQVGVMNEADAPPSWFSDSLQSLPGWNWETDIAAAVHRKFAINCVINPLTAVLKCRNGELVSNEAYASKLRTLCDECQPALDSLDFWRDTDSLFEAASGVCVNTASNRSSMLQDVMAGRETEMRYLGGELLTLAAKDGVDLPKMAELTQKLT